MRIAVIGHVEHVVVGRVAAVPGPGEIAHLGDVCFFPGGGGGVTFFQLAKSGAEVHLFTAFGNDEAAAQVEERVARAGGHLHAARRDLPHTRDVVLIPPGGERTIVVLGQPLHPEAKDPLPWDLLGSCDAAYFTAQDPELVRRARRSRLLVVSARRREALVRSGVRADLVVGSALDARERSTLADYPLPPAALVLTEGAAGGRVETAEGIERFAAPRDAPSGGGAYGAGDSFAGALVFHVARGVPLREACARAARHGAAVLAGLDPLRHQLALEG